MVSRVATLRLQLVDAVSGPSKATTAALKNLETSIKRLGKDGAPGAKNLANQLEYLRQKSVALGRFSDLRRGLATTFGEFRQARARVKELEAALNSVSKPTAKMKADLRSAQSVLRQTGTAMREQRDAAQAAGRALATFSTNSRSAADAQRKVRSETAKTIREMRNLERESRKPKPKPPAQPPRPPARTSGRSATGVAAGAAGGYAAHRAGNVAREAFMNTVSYDQAKSYRDALGGNTFSDDDKQRMNKQAEKIGYETRFTNADVVGGQTGLLQAGIRDAQKIINAMQPITDYALAMGVTLEEATETVRGGSQIKQIDLGDAKAVGKFVDSLVWMAKNAGMDDGDVRQYVRYGGASLKGIGISDPVQAAMGVILRRSGTPGDEAGVFTRTAAAKLGAPTSQGRMALQAMGLNYDDYVTWPDAFKVDGLSKMIREKYGKAVPKGIQDEISRFIDEDTFIDEITGEEMPVGSDRGVFVDGIMARLEKVFPKMMPKDRESLARNVGDFHKYSAESVDSERLLMDIFKSDPSLAQLNAFFTQRQGNRANMIAARYPEFLQAVEDMKNPPQEIAHNIGVDANKGLYGDYTRATGAVETALIKAVEDWEAPIKAVLKSVDYLASEFTQLGDNTRRVVEGMAALGAILGIALAAKAGKTVLQRLLGIGGVAAGEAAAGTTGGAKGAAARVLGKAAGTGAAVVGAGVDIYDAATDETLSDKERSGRYTGAVAGAGGMVVGAKAGGTIGSYAGPYGALIGAGIGAGAGYLTSSGAGRWLGEKLYDDDPTRPAGDKLAAETATWHVAAQQGMRDYINVLATGGTEAETKAGQIAQQIQDTLTVDGKLTVDVSQLQRALDLARQVAAVVQSTRGGSGSTVSASGGSLDPKLDGKRAAGGPVKAGHLYQINERGQELFAPGADGTIIPNHNIPSGGGSGGVVVHAPVKVDVTVSGGGDAASIKAAIQQGVEEAVRKLDAKLARSLQTSWSNLAYGDR